MGNESTGKLLIEVIRQSVRKNKELGKKVDAVLAELDQLSQRLKILEDKSSAVHHYER
jgi:hypothetical protein